MIDAARSLCDGADDNSEYVRGVAELMIDSYRSVDGEEKEALMTFLVTGKSSKEKQMTTERTGIRVSSQVFDVIADDVEVVMVKVTDDGHVPCINLGKRISIFLGHNNAFEEFTPSQARTELYGIANKLITAADGIEDK